MSALHFFEVLPSSFSKKKPIFASFKKLIIDTFPTLSDTNNSEIIFPRLCEHISKKFLFKIRLPISTVQVFADLIKKQKELFYLSFFSS